MIPVVFAQARFKKDTTAFKHKRYAKCNCRRISIENE